MCFAHAGFIPLLPVLAEWSTTGGVLHGHKSHNLHISNILGIESDA